MSIRNIEMKFYNINYNQRLKPDQMWRQHNCIIELQWIPKYWEIIENTYINLRKVT